MASLYLMYKVVPILWFLINPSVNIPNWSLERGGLMEWVSVRAASALENLTLVSSLTRYDHLIAFSHLKMISYII